MADQQFEPENDKLPSSKPTVLLIGSTGNGKSTLGNFLMNPAFLGDPDDPGTRREVFEMGTDNMPTTKDPKKESFALIDDVFGYRCVYLTIIDTPGLNELAGANADLENMAKIVTVVKQEKDIAACIFVVKFDSPIDKQYEDTIKYYSKLLKFLFVKNLFIVMTNYATDEDSVIRRKMQGINEEEIVANVKEKNSQFVPDEYSSSRRDIMLFQLDCLPVNEEAKKVSLDVRSAILDYITHRSPIPCSAIRSGCNQNCRCSEMSQ